MPHLTALCNRLEKGYSHAYNAIRPGCLLGFYCFFLHRNEVALGQRVSNVSVSRSAELSVKNITGEKMGNYHGMIDERKKRVSL